jgi:hypothetical protein
VVCGLCPARPWLLTVVSSATARDRDGDGARDGLQLRGAAAVGPVARGGFAGGGGVANYGVNPTRLAPQPAAGVRVVGQGLRRWGLGRRRRAGYAWPFVGFALPLRRRGRLADERREFTLSVIGLLVML